MSGYLRNVALNKVLLTNERWPFVLSTPLHADLVVGIDVKHNTAGFTMVGKNGGQVRTLCRKSRQREMLLTDQVATYMLELIRLEAAASDELIRTIVVHRDGRLWESEREGMLRAIDRLRTEGVIASDATVTILEISKTSPVSLRLFDVDDATAPNPNVLNPQVGGYLLDRDNDGYVCTTGRAFPRKGTVNPLHVRLVEGPLPLVHCLEDLYSLTTLAWTRPEDCTRDPITIKLNDRRLGEDAGEYDSDALSFAEGGNGEDVA
jgi:argonaute-like protein implicated in RNA metabolism and viral defense